MSQFNITYRPNVSQEYFDRWLTDNYPNYQYFLSDISSNITLYFSSHTAQDEVDITDFYNNTLTSENLKEHLILDLLSDQELYSGSPYDINYDILPIYKYEVVKHGDIIKMIGYKDYDNNTGIYSNPVVEEISVYQDNSFGDPDLRTVTHSWYYKDGTKDLTTKTKIKKYSSWKADQAGKRRRKNIISNIKEPLIGFIMATEGDDLLTASGKGIAFLTDYENDMVMWVDNPGSYALQAALTNDTTTLWLDNTLNSGIITAVISNLDKRTELLNDPAPALTDIRSYLMYEVNY